MEKHNHIQKFCLPMHELLYRAVQDCEKTCSSCCNFENQAFLNKSKLSFSENPETTSDQLTFLCFFHLCAFEYLRQIRASNAAFELYDNSQADFLKAFECYQRITFKSLEVPVKTQKLISDVLFNVSVVPSFELSELIHTSSTPMQVWRAICAEGRAFEGAKSLAWAYQYYGKRKHEVSKISLEGKALHKEQNIIEQTQVFTPDWMVRFVVDNALGNTWVSYHKHSNLREKLSLQAKDYKLDVDEIKACRAEDIRIIDPACGAGLMLEYAFDLLVCMYKEQETPVGEIPYKIFTNNLYALDIDEYAVYFLEFVLLIKALELSDTFDAKLCSLHTLVCANVAFSKEEQNYMPFLAQEEKLLDSVKHFDACGMLLRISSHQENLIDQAYESVAAYASSADSSLCDVLCGLQEKLKYLKQVSTFLNQGYQVVLENPPYMALRNMDSWLNAWIKKHYPLYKHDLFSCCMVRSFEMAQNGARLAFVTPFVWMFLDSYEKLRLQLCKQNTLLALVQLEYSAFQGAMVPVCLSSFIKTKQTKYPSLYVRLNDFSGAENQEPRTFEALHNIQCPWAYRVSFDEISDIPLCPLVYWEASSMRHIFKEFKPLSYYADVRQGIATGNNKRFVRLWWEITPNCLNTSIKDSKSIPETDALWVPYNKGGKFQKWYGNNEYVIAFDTHSRQILQRQGNRLPNKQYYFKESITWSKVSSGVIAFRYKPAGSVFDVAGTSVFADSEPWHIYKPYLIVKISCASHACFRQRLILK